MSKKKASPKIIHIATLQDILDASTPENFLRLTADVALWIRVNVAMKAAGVDSQDVAMEWKDDGINGITGFKATRRKP